MGEYSSIGNGSNAISLKNKPGYVNPYENLLSGAVEPVYENLFSALFSGIQIKSLWSKLALDTDFMLTFLFRVKAAIDAGKAEGAEKIILTFGDREVLFTGNRY